MYYLLFDHHKCNTNKQTNKCFIVNQDAHNEQYNQYSTFFFFLVLLLTKVQEVVAVTGT
jgi:hypothetical protein